MLLSIIVPLYNAEEWIEHAIVSVTRQDMTNIELILINDGSTDNSEEICNKYVCENVIYKYIDNGGAGRARNVGINLARGKWISFLDSDDLYINGFLGVGIRRYLEDCFEKEIDIISAAKAKTDINISKEIRYTLPENNTTEIKFIPKLEFWTCIYRKDYLERHNIRFYEYREQDIESAFRFEAFYNTKNIFVDEKLCFYLARNNERSNTHTWNLYSLYDIKARVYGDLYFRYGEKDKFVRIFLASIILEYTYLYIKLCLVQGYKTDKTENLFLSLKKLFQLINKNDFISEKKYRRYYNRLRFVYHNNFFVDLWCKYLAGKKKPKQKEKFRTIDFVTVEELFKRMDQKCIYGEIKS